MKIIRAKEEKEIMAVVVMGVSLEKKGQKMILVMDQKEKKEIKESSKSGLNRVKGYLKNLIIMMIVM